MAGMKENKTAIGITIQPTPGQFNEPTTADLLAISAPDDGYDDVTADDPTLTGSMFAGARQFLGRRGRAGATAVLRGPGGSNPPAAGAYVLGRVLQGAAFSEVINPTEIIGAAQAGGSTSSIILPGSFSSVDDFYKLMPIQHATIGGADTIRGTSIIREYDGATKTATLMETVAAAITAGDVRIPPSLNYILGVGNNIPLLSAKVWRDKKARRYRDCAITSFAINIPVGNLQSTDAPTIEFAMAGVPVSTIDEQAPTLPDRLLTPAAFARKGKFAFNGIKIGHQTLRFEFGYETAALPNQNFDEGQESYEQMSGTRAVTLDINDQLQAVLDVDTLVEAQAFVPIISGWGQNKGDRFIASCPNGPLNSFSPNPRAGFVGLQGGIAPSDVDRSIGFSIIY